MKIIDVNSWNKILDNMVMIGGSARSGTTIMGKLINSLEKVEYYFEPPMLTSLLLKEDELSNDSLKELLQFYFYDNFLLDCLAGRNINLNRNDDSCIYNVKSEKEIQKRLERSWGRVELEEIVDNSTFSFKLPEILFFLDTMDTLFPANKKILMHRNPNDVINSIVRKGWFSDELLSHTNPSQIYAVKIINNIKVPYWVKSSDEDFWIKANELNRCAYYYKRISESIVAHSNNSTVVNYDEFIKKPQQTLDELLNKLDLKATTKTSEILSSVKYQEKKRADFLSDISSELKRDIEKLDEQLNTLSI